VVEVWKIEEWKGVTCRVEVLKGGENFLKRIWEA
jgi:hypothetical protein